MQTLVVSVLSVLSLVACAVSAGAEGEPSPVPTNPFETFIGEWTLKDDRFDQVWDGETVETLSIPNHYTVCRGLNTQGSVLCEVDAGGFAGHILWSADEAATMVSHQSHFGQARLGRGTGQLTEAGGLDLKISFTDEAEGTYRLYSYTWVTPDEYVMMSRQYDASGTATGNRYGGSFVRITAGSK